MKKILTLAALGALLAPLPSLAATYQYVAIDGTVQDVEAATAQEALAMISVRSDVTNSGVKLDTGVLEEGEQVGHVYTYVAVDGTVRSIYAANIDAAYLLATDRMFNSGFIVAA